MRNISKHRHSGAGTLGPWGWVPTLYFAEGLPYVAVNTLSVVLYTDLGVSNSRMAFYTSLLYLPWVVKFAWSPIVDVLRTKRWWILAMQWLMAVLLGGIALAIPCSPWFVTTLVLFWITAFASATHDVAADGFYMLALDENRQSLFVGIRSTFYRFATIFGNGVLVALAGVMEHRTREASQAWQIVFVLTAGILCLCALWHCAVLPRRRQQVNAVRDNSVEARTVREVIAEVAQSFATFFAKPGVWLSIVFLLLYRLPEALILKMIYPFLMNAPELGGLGLDKEIVGVAYGAVGVAGLLIGGIIGGWVGSRYGLCRCMRPMAWAMSLTCGAFLLLALLPQPQLWVVFSCITIEQLGYGFGFSAYMLYMLYISQGRFATSHYALCTAFMAASMMLPGLVAGWLQECLGYTWFFVLCMICCVATIGVTYLVKVDPQFGIKNPSHKRC